MNIPLKIFIGFDQAESVAYHVFEYSIQQEASGPVSITPLRLDQLKGIHNRDRHPLQSNDFSFSRWLVPYLCNYKGYALFADCDMLCRGDIYELFKLADPNFAVQVVKHNHEPKEDTKYLGNKQTTYEKKNWSSVVLFNCEACKALTPKYVNTASGLDLHQFKWLFTDKLIGELPPEWNHLVGYDEPNPKAKIAHFTEGGPYFHEYRGCEFTDEWESMRDKMSYCLQSSKEDSFPPILDLTSAGAGC